MQPLHFAPLQRTDFALLSAWLATAHVQRWWHDNPSLDAIEADYGGCIDGAEPAAVFIAYRNDQPIGLIQRYRFGAYPQYIDELAAILPVAAEWTSIDYLIGPPEALGRGWGTAMIAAFVADTWAADPSTPAIIVPVQADNIASRRALSRAGFTLVAHGSLTPDNPLDSDAHALYRIDRT